MTNATRALLLWAPRILGIALCVFLGLFALDAFEPDRPVRESVPGFLIHLAPSALVLTVVLVSWRREWIGGLGFVALAVAYALMVGFRLDWMLVISGPLVLVGAWFLWNWRHRRALHTP